MIDLVKKKQKSKKQKCIKISIMFHLVGLIILCVVLVGCSNILVMKEREPRKIYVDSSSLIEESMGTIDVPIKSIEQLNH